jgi:hypothetical protein
MDGDPLAGLGEGLPGVLGLPNDDMLGLGGLDSPVDSLERDIPLSRSSAEGIGGVTSLSLSFPFELPPRLNKALSAPELFFSDKPDDFRPPSFSSGVLFPLAIPRSRCAAFCISLSSFLLGFRSASTEGRLDSRDGRKVSAEGRSISSDRRVRKGGVEPCLDTDRKRFNRPPIDWCTDAESSTADGGVEKDDCLPRAEVGEVLRS